MDSVEKGNMAKASCTVETGLFESMQAKIKNEGKGAFDWFTWKKNWTPCSCFTWKCFFMQNQTKDVSFQC